MVAKKLSAQKYNGARGKADLLKRIAENLRGKADPSDVSPEDVWKSYGLGQLTCGKHNVSGPKATNCKENPYCLGRLGLEKFEKLIKKSEDVRNEKMIESVKRDTLTQPCGLVNWANFCYVNSFLQIWFNDPVFRQIIYDWRPSDAYVIPQPPAMDVQQVMTALQHLFFQLDTTPYEDANAEAFCTALRLNQEQQDAQEFTVMFFDSIDRNLSKHPNGRNMKERIEERFNGLQTSILRCKCSHHSDNSTKFSALNLSIDGHNSLSAAIAGYFANERLSDFACSGCGKRGEVVRETRIDHLPPVLLLSLNRYVYDSTTGRRKKLKTPLQYPRLLNVDGLPHGEKLEEASKTYELSAVMVHEGDNADCGHYWDIIRHPYSGKWFKYNDKIVKETKAPGVETEKAEASLKSAIDLKYCYGLVYRRREAARAQQLPPEEISGKWTKEMEHKFYRMTDTEAQASECTLEEVTQRFRVVGEHMAALEVKPDRAKQQRARDLAFLPTRLLSDILSTEYARAVKIKEELENIADELDRTDCEKEEESMSSQASDTDGPLSSPQKRRKNVRRRVKSMYDKRLEQVEIAMSLSPASLTLCPHDRISYDSVLAGEVKAVNKAGADKLIKDYGLAVNVVNEEGVARSDRLRTGLEVCTECIKEKARDVQFMARLEEDATLATKIGREVDKRCSVKYYHKNKVQPPADNFYVSKSALSSFKRDALRERQFRSQATRASSTWTIGPASAARAAVGAVGAVEKRRRKRAAGVGEAVGEAEEEEEEKGEEPVAKCARSEMSVVRPTNGKKEEEEEEEVGVKDDVEDAVRNMMDQLAGPSSSQPAASSNGHAAAAASNGVAAAEIVLPDLLGEGRRKKKDVEEEEDEEMNAEEEQEVKRAGKEGSNVTEDSSELPSSPTANDEENGQEGEANGRNGGSSNDDEENNQPIVFNDQLRCEHGGLNVNEFRHSVDRKDWLRLSSYFERVLEVPARKPVCAGCQDVESSASADKEASSAVIKVLADDVGDVLKAAVARTNAAPTLLADGENFTRGVCSRFVENAKKFLNPRSKVDALPPLCQSCVLCDHGLPRYGRTKIEEDVSNLFIVPLTKDEWSRLKAAWSTAAYRLIAAGGAADSLADGFEAVDIELCPISGAVSSECTPCAKALRELIESAKFEYEAANIYVKMQIDDQPASKSGEKEEKGGKGSKEGSKEGSEETPDIVPLEIVTAPAPSNGGGGRQVGAGGRANTRRGANKGLIKVRMASHQTIKELKIALLKHVNYSPVDQLLYSTLGGDPLDDELTLEVARIPKENIDSPIILIVQSGCDAMLCSPVNEKNRVVERGFYDTALAH